MGRGELRLRPLPPPVWRPLAVEHIGPAQLCLALLPWACAEPVEWDALPAGACADLLRDMCAPWLGGEAQAQLEALDRWLAARRDYPGLSCAACQDQEAKGEGRPDCALCPRPATPPLAAAAVELHNLLAGVLPEQRAWLLERTLARLPGQSAWAMAIALGRLAQPPTAAEP